MRALAALALLVFGAAAAAGSGDQARIGMQAAAERERAAAERRQAMRRVEREHRQRSAAAHARMRDAGVDTMHASSPSPDGAMCLAPGVEPDRFSPNRLADASPSDGGAASVVARATDTSRRSRAVAATGKTGLGLHRPSPVQSLLETRAHEPPLRERRVAFLPSASREPAQRGILRLASRDDHTAIVSVTAFDDTGRRFGPATVSLAPHHTLELTSSDLEGGNPIKGLPRGVGAGQGDWRLVVRSSARFDAYAYAQTVDGLRSPLRQVAESPTGPCLVSLFPSADADAPGALRLGNPSAEPTTATIHARDDAGREAEVRVLLPPGASRWLTVSALESGRGVSGALGDGAGDWRLAIRAPAPIHATALSASPGGELGVLSSSHRVRSSVSDARALQATLPGAAGLLRIVNRTAVSGMATLETDAGGRRIEPVPLRVAAHGAVTLTASDLEFGSPSKGLPRGFGPLSSDLRVTARSDLELDVLAYVRAQGGRLSAMQDIAPRAGAPNRHVLPMFPAGAAEAEGHLLLANRSGTPARVRIAGIDDEGNRSQPATLTLPAGGAKTITSTQLAWGAPALDGWLGAGRGHWRLSVWSDGPLGVTALLATPSGALSNISAASPPSSTRQAPQPIGDLNGDGRDDVLLRHVDGRWMYYPMNDRTPIESGRGTAALERSAHWQLAGIGDMDGDGNDDILLRHTGGEWKGYLMDGRTVLDSGTVAGLPTDPEWNIAGLGDLGGDGRTDVVLRHDSGGWLHAPLDGLATAPSVAVEPPLTKSRKWSVAGIADLNGDGNDDILMRHEDGRWHYYPMNGSQPGSDRGSVTDVTRSLDWQLAGLGDLNGDGKQDILLRHVEGRWTFYPMNGRNVADGKGSVAITPNPAWTMAGLGDLNGDGNADALLRHDDGRWTYYPLDGRTILAGHGTAGITRNPDWSTTGPDLEPEEATKDDDPADETAGDVFASAISHIVQSQCATCHVAGGVSGTTRLVFVAGTGADERAANLAAFEGFLEEVDDGAALVLNKVQGVSHGGGIQLASGTEGFAAMERFLGLLTDGPGTGPSVAPATLFAGVKMEPARSTLRRAAIVFAGRVPTDAEYESIKTGGIASLRKAIRGLMTGPGFHEFLIRGANDRLLTDRDLAEVIDEFHGHFPDLANRNYELALAAEGGTTQDKDTHERWRDDVQYGFARAPLELIVHVAEGDRPYTEILTASYIMANPLAADAYGASTQFENLDDVNEFRPSEIAAYYRKGEGYVEEVIPGVGTRVHDPGPLATDYPHAGILNTTAFLRRYPTTATNRNRARSRWTYYHFLGLDIEKSASRTTDPVALADTNNPTMHNQACTVCHTVMDPVAGAFQNYGDEGLYRDQWGGLDALDDLYKFNPAGRIDVSVAARSRRDAPRTSLGTVRLRADGPNELGLKNVRTFDGDRKLHLGLGEVVLRDSHGGAVTRLEVRDAAKDAACGGASTDSYTLWDCKEMLILQLDVPKDGDYDVTIEAWVQETGTKPTTLQAWMPGPFHRQGDTWYRDMRLPGFGDEAAPDADQGLRWLAERFIADPRFAEATVKFWWPSVMGSDVVQPPSADDPDFRGRLLASNAQAAEVERLAGAFRRGFGGGRRYNLKDLLVEFSLSKWFRAETLTESDPTRSVALSGAGAKRLLTPEELSRKTVSLTGFDWNRRPRRSWNAPADALNWTNAENMYGLLYGGIDSDGTTKRGRDLTSVMAGVAQRHAATVACPIVMKDLYLVAEGDRKLLGGIDPTASPGRSTKFATSAERLVRDKLVELHDRLLGVQVEADSAEIQASFDLFVDVWRRARASNEDDFRKQQHCYYGADRHYFDGILDDHWQEDEHGPDWNWDRVNEFIWRETDMPDPHGIARTWVVVLAYLMTDPRYLHL